MSEKSLKEPPRHVNTLHGHVRVLVLPWLQYIAIRVKRHGIKYISKKTSAGYPRILSLGYYSRSHGEIVLAKVGDENYILAKERLDILGDEYEITKELKGKELLGLEYKPLFEVAELKSDKSYKIYPAGNKRESRHGDFPGIVFNGLFTKRCCL